MIVEKIWNAISVENTYMLLQYRYSQNLKNEIHYSRDEFDSNLQKYKENILKCTNKMSKLYGTCEKIKCSCRSNLCSFSKRWIYGNWLCNRNSKVWSPRFVILIFEKVSIWKGQINFFCVYLATFAQKSDQIGEANKNQRSHAQQPNL